MGLAVSSAFLFLEEWHFSWHWWVTRDTPDPPDASHVGREGFQGFFWRGEDGYLSKARNRMENKEGFRTVLSQECDLKAYCSP